MNNNIRWIAIVGSLLIAIVVGFWAYNAGVAHGVEQSGKIAVPPSGPYPYPYPHYGWHGPGGFGFFFVPLFFFAFWFLVIRGLFWRRRGWYGGCGPRDRFDKWHRQAHERGEAEPVPGAAGER
jgi:hypothetical protein